MTVCLQRQDTGIKPFLQPTTIIIHLSHKYESVHICTWIVSFSLRLRYFYLLTFFEGTWITLINDANDVYSSPPSYSWRDLRLTFSKCIVAVNSLQVSDSGKRVLVSCSSFHLYELFLFVTLSIVDRYKEDLSFFLFDCFVKVTIINLLSKDHSLCIRMISLWPYIYIIEIKVTQTRPENIQSLLPRNELTCLLLLVSLVFIHTHVYTLKEQNVSLQN